MQRNDQEDHGHSHETSIAHLSIQQVSNGDGEERGTPHVVEDNRDQIEPIHVVGEEIHHLTRGCIAQGCLRELGGLAINNTADGHTDSHARGKALDQKLVVVQGGEQIYAHDPRGRQPGVGFGQSIDWIIVLPKVLQESAEQQWLAQLGHFVDGEEGG